MGNVAKAFAVLCVCRRVGASHMNWGCWISHPLSLRLCVRLLIPVPHRTIEPENSSQRLLQIPAKPSFHMYPTAQASCQTQLQHMLDTGQLNPPPRPNASQIPDSSCPRLPKNLQAQSLDILDSSSPIPQDPSRPTHPHIVRTSLRTIGGDGRR